MIEKINLFLLLSGIWKRLLFKTFPCAKCFTNMIIMPDINQTKEELIESISELFLTYGLRSTSMDDICAHLKISKKTLYKYFENKEDIVEQVMMYRIDTRDISEVIESVSRVSPIEFLYDIKIHIIEDLNSLRPSNYFDVRKYHPEVHDKILERETSFLYALLEIVISQGISQGFFREDINKDVQIYLFSKDIKFLKEIDMLNALKYPAPVLISTILDNFILSLSTIKGFNEFERIKNEKGELNLGNVKE